MPRKKRSQRVAVADAETEGSAPEREDAEQVEEGQVLLVVVLDEEVVRAPPTRAAAVAASPARAAAEIAAVA